MDFLRIILQQLNSHPGNVAAQVAFHSFPALVLSKGDSVRTVNDRMLLFYQRNYEALLDNTTIIKHRTGPSKPEHKLKRAQAKMRKGQISDAMKVLESSSKPLQHTDSNVAAAKLNQGDKGDCAILTTSRETP